MADEPEAPSKPAGKGIGGTLGKKFGPLPVWGWGLVVGALGIVAYRYYAAKNAASASTAATTAVGAGTTATGAPLGTSVGGNGYSGGDVAAQLAALTAQLQSQGTGSTSAGPGTAPTVGSNPGGGFFAPPGGGGYESSGGLNYLAVTSSAELAQLLAAGQQVFEQPAPGVFVPYTGGNVASAHQNTPLFIQSPFSGPAPTPSGAGGSASPVGGTGGAPSPVTSGPQPVATHTPLPAVQSK